MISKASVKFVRIAPRKVRYVIDLIRKKKVNEAQAILSGSPRRAGDIVRKLLDQAVDAAEKNSKVGAENLVVSKVLADGGPSMRRFRAASMGRASIIHKRTSHIYLELELLKGVPAPAGEKAAGKAKKSVSTQGPAAAPATKRGGSKKRKLAGAK